MGSAVSHINVSLLVRDKVTCTRVYYLVGNGQLVQLLAPQAVHLCFLHAQLLTLPVGHRLLLSRHPSGTDTATWSHCQHPLLSSEDSGPSVGLKLNNISAYFFKMAKLCCEHVSHTFLTFGISLPQDTAQPCHLLKPNWKPSSPHGISAPTNINTHECQAERCQGCD